MSRYMLTFAAAWLALSGSGFAEDKKKEGEGKKLPTILRGQFKSADAAAGTVTLSVRSGKGDKAENAPLEDKTFALSKDAKVIVDGKEAKIGDLKPATPVMAKLSGDGKTIEGLMQGKGKEGGKEGGEKPAPKKPENKE